MGWTGRTSASADNRIGGAGVKNPVAEQILQVIRSGNSRGMPLRQSPELNIWTRHRTGGEPPAPPGYQGREIQRIVGAGPGNHYISAVNKQGQKFRVAGPFPSFRAAQEELPNIERNMFLKTGDFGMKLFVEPEGA